MCGNLRTKAKKKWNFINILISVLQREYGDANWFIFITASARKRHEPRGPGVMISLACHQQKKSEVMFTSVGVDFAALTYSCSAVALWTEERSSEYIYAPLAYIWLQPPGWMAAPRTHEDIQMWFCFTVGLPPWWSHSIRKWHQRRDHKGREMGRFERAFLHAGEQPCACLCVHKKINTH